MYGSGDTIYPNNQETRAHENKSIEHGTAENCPTTATVCIVEKKRGFKPSDRHNPQKKQFLLDLSNQIWQKNQGRTNNLSKKIDLDKIFTPATDAIQILPKQRKLYATSAFYSPVLHPTIEDQVELARRISRSLSDVTNEKSKGQSMYVNRKKRSAKWVHEGYNRDFQQEQQATMPNVKFVSAENESARKAKGSLCEEQLALKNYFPASLGLKMEESPEKLHLEENSDFVEHQMHTLGISQSTSLPSSSQRNNTVGYPSVMAQQMNSRSSLKPTKTTFLDDYNRSMAYKPRIPQGWKSPHISLPTELISQPSSPIPLETLSPPLSCVAPANESTSFPGNTLQSSWKPVRFPKINVYCGNTNMELSNYQRFNSNKPSIRYSPTLLMDNELIKHDKVVPSSFLPPPPTREIDKTKIVSSPINIIRMPYTDF